MHFQVKALGHLQLHTEGVVRVLAVPQKRLIEVDIRIEKVREVIASGAAQLETFAELDSLILERTNLVQEIAKLTQNPPPTRREITGI